MKPLEGITVVDLSQFLSGPSAGLRLADLGARTIKVERPQGGDICRSLYVSNTQIQGESTIFHAINRNKESFAADLKQTLDRERVLALLKRADVMIHNFRPGVIERLGLDYATVAKQNPKLIYGEITGYGKTGPWVNKPGQDLLLQALSGMAQPNSKKPPLPLGLAIVDILAGVHLTQGILACLVRRGITGQGGLVEVSMLESALDAQREGLTEFFEQIGVAPSENAAALHPLSGGIYTTQDGHIALGFFPPDQLPMLTDSNEFAQHPTAYWEPQLQQADIPYTAVLPWNDLFEQVGYQTLQMEQDVTLKKNSSLRTTRCPIRIDGERLTSSVGAPAIGEHTDQILQELLRLH